MGALHVQTAGSLLVANFEIASGLLWLSALYACMGIISLRKPLSAKCYKMNMPWKRCLCCIGKLIGWLVILGIVLLFICSPVSWGCA